MAWMRSGVRSPSAPPRFVAALVCAALLVGLATGCTHVKPWERGRLAHPTMTADDLAGPAESHMRGVHEGATGGGSVAESGCGCN